ncbi:Ribonuclease G [Hydrogenophaga sp. T4]|nr:Ribonuclease G [Hydrogenophaga sp. T4]
MSQDILINWAPQETRVAVVEQGAVQEVHLERTLERGLVGNIYLGKISRVLPGMQSAFIDIGLDRAAFLHVADLMPNIAAKHAAPRDRNQAPVSAEGGVTTSVRRRRPWRKRLQQPGAHTQPRVAHRAADL